MGIFNIKSMAYGVGVEMHNMKNKFKQAAIQMNAVPKGLVYHLEILQGRSMSLENLILSTIK